MIQRIQTVYLLIVLLGNLLAVFLMAELLDTLANVFLEFNFEYHLFFGIVSVLSIWAIISFKSRAFQLKLGLFNLFLNASALGFLIYWLLILPGESEISEKGIGFIIPFISIVFIILAQKAIKKDDNLVKSADRFR